ncbi:MAG: Outer membrane protein assembly factor BamB [Alphaproteobacteria bacterium MarineAlpha5_Bin11]|nr:MAG: Outer membrane protein assembly factor BamB [Alphaproteobacteria bacterium MarineAlpha5_Bin11]|tara:strand:+ start:465 stop:1736 length:1272 start_codon:yes stop_codon:yes gene_type:complete
MNFCLLNKLFHRLLLFLFLSLIISCSSFEKKEIINEYVIDEDKSNFIQTGPLFAPNQINKYWQFTNVNSYKFNYVLTSYDNFKFGEGGNNLKFIISNPIIDGDYIYLIDNESLLTKYSISEKKILFQKELLLDNLTEYSWPASLILRKDLIVATMGNGSIVCIDTQGNKIWDKDFNMSIRTASYFIDDILFIFLNNGKLISLDIKTGDKISELNKEASKISSFYGGKFFEYKNNLYAISPKGEIHIMDNFLFEYSELDKRFNLLFNPTGNINMDYNLSIWAFNDILYINESNEYLTTYDLLNDKILLKRFLLPRNKYLTHLNNSIILIDDDEYLVSINPTNGKIFWKINISKIIKKNQEIIKIIETESKIIIFISNGKILYLNKLTGILENDIDTKLANLKSVYFHKDYLIFITNKAKIHIYN